MMNCDQVKLLLSDYIDGVLEPRLKEELDNHLESDPDCKKVFEQATIIYRQITSLPPVKPSQEFDIHLRNRIIGLNKSDEKQHVINKKGLSLVFSGTVLVAALYLFIFTDVGTQQKMNEGIMPSSTIGSNPSSFNVDNTEKNIEPDKNTVADSLNKLPEKVENDKIHLTGKEE
jgi:predicted anti-sigma-YlaC factor YlaD